MAEKIRLHKYLVNCGLTSRRKAEQLIQSGLVSVNGRVNREIVQLINPTIDIVALNGKVIRSQKQMYFSFHKPAGVTTTLGDDKDHKAIADFFTDINARVFPVGRLDKDTSGLLLVTNDGDFANTIAHPKRQIDKVYEALLDRPLTDNDLKHLESGIRLKEGVTSPATIIILNNNRKTLAITIHQGWNRQIRRMFGILNYTVLELKRTKIGPVNLGTLAPGTKRPLTEAEIKIIDPDHKS